jgi:hypothetical protein
MKFELLLFAGLFFITVLLNGQTDFQPGYVIKTTGDTLIGEIDYRGDILMGKVCRFKLNNTDKEVSYSPDDINEFKFNESKYYVSKEVKGQKMFLQFLIKGKVNIYSQRDQTGDHFFIEKAGLGLSELPYEQAIMYKENIPYEYRSKTHMGILNIYMQDAPEFQSRIATIYKPEQRWLVELAEDYHNRVCKDERCIIFERKLPFLKVNLEVIAGVNNFKNRMDEYFYKWDGKQNYFQAGVVADFWMPRVNEKLYLRTGILYSTFESNNTSKKYLKIPIQVKYIYPKGIIRPNLAYGINLYRPFSYTVSITPGLNMKITKSVSIEINYFADFLPNNIFPLFPNGIFSSGILSGLYIEL